ncbi:hypothetical protein EAG_08740 [Camponotus floridanus]|uniref:Uncharacterized protein n=1 Tax=Camponotus floridanus TaxID=104421 RepID=E2A808_CAMFO|nr:hypothetical protein EAG_08740 [Camponotus floridanus]
MSRFQVEKITAHGRDESGVDGVTTNRITIEQRDCKSIFTMFVISIISDKRFSKDRMSILLSTKAYPEIELLSNNETVVNHCQSMFAMFTISINSEKRFSRDRILLSIEAYPDVSKRMRENISINNNPDYNNSVTNIYTIHAQINLLPVKPVIKSSGQCPVIAVISSAPGAATLAQIQHVASRTEIIIMFSVYRAALTPFLKYILQNKKI